MIKLNSILLPLTLTLILSGCSNNSYDDIKTWMKEKTISQKGHIKPLPQAKTFVPIEFVAKSDPFKEKPVVALSLEKNKYTPNPDRRKEPLESYPLENLKMTGTLIKDKVFYALILTPDGNINYVTKNNYIGTNYGKIMDVSEGQMVLDERVKNSSDEWEPKKTIINLEEVDNRK